MANSVYCGNSYRSEIFVNNENKWLGCILWGSAFIHHLGCLIPYKSDLGQVLPASISELVSSSWTKREASDSMLST